jgi:hypothetical protein
MKPAEHISTEVVELVQSAAGDVELRRTLVSTHWPENLAIELPLARPVRTKETTRSRTIIAGVGGLAFEVTSASLQDLVLDLAPRLQPLGATVYGLGPQRGLHEISATEQETITIPLTDRIARVWAVIIPARDAYEPLRVERPGSADLPFPNLIQIFKEWAKVCSFEILSAGARDVEIIFRELPVDISSFAKRVVKVSPGAMNGVYLGEPMEGWEPVDYITATDDQTPSDLARSIQRTKRLYMFWD